MDTGTQSAELMDFIKSLASESRMEILLLFMERPQLTVNEISELVGLGQSTTSEHLTMLKRAGVLHSRKENRQVIYTPNREKILEILDLLSQILRRCCE